MCNPDEQVAFLLSSFQDDHTLLRGQVYSHTFNCHLNHIFELPFLWLGPVESLTFLLTFPLYTYPKPGANEEDCPISSLRSTTTRVGIFLFHSSFESIAKCSHYSKSPHPNMT